MNRRQRDIPVTLLCCLGICLSTGQLGGDGRKPQAADQAGGQEQVNWAQRIEPIVRQLGHRSYQQRQQASARLGELPHEALPALLEAYHRSQLPETRLRIRRGIEPLVIKYLSQPQRENSGFLGISFSSNAVPVTVGPDQEIQMQLVVYVTQVLEGTPAAEAGLESGDQILAVGNRLAGSFDSGDAFSAHLAKLKPGTKTTLAVSRGNAMVSLTVTIGHRLIDAPEPYRSQWLKQAEGQFWADQSNRPGKDR